MESRMTRRRCSTRLILATACCGSTRGRIGSRSRWCSINGIEIVGEHPDAVGIELRKTMKCVIRVLGQSRDNLITGNILGGATEELLDASGDSSELRNNLLLRQGI